MNNNNSQIHNNDFNAALNIYQNSYSHNDLIKFLKIGSIAEKQAAALKLDSINNINEAKIFINNLTGCDGKIREAVSFRLEEFIHNNPGYYTKFCDEFLQAVIDINGNICRNTIKALEYLKNQPEFTDEFCSKLTLRSLELIKPIKEFNIQVGKYKINKEVFKLYWYLETIATFYKYIDENKLFEILNETINIQDYTIREKTAKILSKLQNIKKFSDLKDKLSNDKNYYVRRICR